MNHFFIQPKNAFASSLIFFILFINGKNVYSQANQMNAAIDKLLKQMTLEEKVGQMTQVTLSVVSVQDKNGTVTEPHAIDTSRLEKAIVKYKIGSILNSVDHGYDRQHWYEIISAIQQMAMNKTRLKIPVLYGIDAIHGVTYTNGSTLFPQELGLAATFNSKLVEQAGAITAYETRASFIPWNFSPVLDLGMNPLWPRLYETFGEDPFLAKTMATAMVRGYQGDGDVMNEYHVAACLKHYMGYSFPKSGKDRTSAWIPDRYLREYFLPSFAAAVQAGAKTVMVNSSDINGIPVHSSKYLLTDVLKGELGFRGLVVSDWNDIKFLCTKYHIASDIKEAGEIAVNAGIDMSMVPSDFSFAENLVESVKEGKVPMSRIDDAVRRILRVKLELNLWNNPVGNPDSFPDFGSEKHIQAAKQSALESIILLKNENNILPLSKNTRVLVTGPTANTMRSLNGGWTYTWQGERSDEFAKEKHTILEGIETLIGKKNVQYVEGAAFDSINNIDEIVKAANQCDVIILCLGELSYAESPGNINDLALPDAQITLANTLAKTGKPVVLVLAEGRPRLINKIEPLMNAVLLGFLPGNEGGDAIAEILFGDYNPSGKLPVTYPKYANALFNYYRKNGESWLGSDEAGYDPQYEFGYGLSYTKFEYGKPMLNDTILKDNDSLSVSIDVKNTGNREGEEVVQLYISDLVASITPDVKRLRGFEKITLHSGEIKRVSFIIKKEDLAFVGLNSKLITEPGEFRIEISDKVATFRYPSVQPGKPVVYDKL